MVSTVLHVILAVGQTITYLITPPVNHNIGWISTMALGHVKTINEEGYGSENGIGDNTLNSIPVFEEINKQVKTEFINDTTEAQDYYVTIFFYNKTEIGEFLKKIEKPIRLIPADSFGQTITVGKEFILFKNQKTHKVYISAMIWTIYNNITVANLKINGKEIGTYTSAYQYGQPIGCIIYIKQWLQPGDKLTCIPEASSIGTTGQWLAWLEIDNIEIGIYKQTAPNETHHILNAIFAMKLSEIISKKPIPPVPPQQLPQQIPPYPVPPNQQYLLVPSIPKPISITTTDLYDTPNNPIPTLLNLPGEQRTVEVLPSPFGAVRKSADTMGRLRTTGAIITYGRGTLSVTDAVAHVVWTGYGSKNIFLKPVAENWTIQVLPLYDWLAGKTIADMPQITLNLGEQISWDMETREIQATCPTGSATITGTLNWEVDL